MRPTYLFAWAYLRMRLSDAFYRTAKYIASGPLPMSDESRGEVCGLSLRPKEKTIQLGRYPAGPWELQAFPHHVCLEPTQL